MHAHFPLEPADRFRLYVGWIGEDYIGPAHRRQPVGNHEKGAPGEAQAGRVLPSGLYSARHDVDADADGVFPLGKHRQQDRTAAGANVDDPRMRAPADHVQRGIDKRLGFRPRHQRIGGEDEVESVKFLVADDACHRLAMRAPFGKAKGMRGQLGTDRFVVVERHRLRR